MRSEASMFAIGALKLRIPALNPGRVRENIALLRIARVKAAIAVCHSEHAGIQRTIEHVLKRFYISFVAYSLEITKVVVTRCSKFKGPNAHLPYSTELVLSNSCVHGRLNGDCFSGDVQHLGGLALLSTLGCGMIDRILGPITRVARRKFRFFFSRIAEKKCKTLHLW